MTNELETVLGKLSGVIKNGNGFKAQCPAHDDKNPSLSIGVGSNGSVILRCHAGCSTDAILSELGMTMKDLFASDQHRQQRRIVATYDYLDESENLLFQTVRYEPKDFRQRRPDGKNWIWNLGGTRRILYRLPEVLKTDPSFPVFVVEGEKDVDALLSIGVTATCSPLGAGKWRDEFSESLNGRRCVLLPDNDTAGVEHANAVAKSLIAKAAEISILRLPGLPEKGDVFDWIAKGNTQEDLFALLTGADLVTKEEIDRVFQKQRRRSNAIAIAKTPLPDPEAKKRKHRSL